METVIDRFLSALKCALLWEKTDWQEDMDDQEWLALFQMAEQHHVLPMIYEAVYSCPSAKRADPQLFLHYRQRTFQLVMMQTMKTGEFLMLYNHLDQAGLRPLVVKGLVCRNLYPNPDYRMSGDEDMLIGQGQYDLCHRAMTDFGMAPAEPDQDREQAYEVPYVKKDSPLYIELHKQLFPPESDAYGDFNGLFDGVEDRAIELKINGTTIRTMGHTDHLFYLICHAFKHFLHSGFGIRQVCDIILYANQFGADVDWTDMLERCRKINGELFAAAIFKIGEKYLTFDKERAFYPDEWRELAVDENPLLVDLVDSGVYGGASMSRKHSSGITLNAVAARKKGHKNAGAVIKTIFPSVKNLEGRFAYLKKYPWLLPVAWISRLLKYGRETKRLSDNHAAGAVQIGSRRVELLKIYKIIE